MSHGSDQCITWMVNDATSSELRLVSILANALYLQAKPAEAEVKEIPGIHKHAVDAAYKSAKKMVDARKRGERKDKKAKKTMDAAAILANRKGPKAKGNTNGTVPDVYRGLKGRVYEALKQTTGKITSIELAEILEVKPPQKVSEVLSQGFKAGGIKGLFREAGKTTLSTGKTIPTYLYWLDGGLK